MFDAEPPKTDFRRWLAIAPDPQKKKKVAHSFGQPLLNYFKPALSVKV
jgi:hypothetical protein